MAVFVRALTTLKDDIKKKQFFSRHIPIDFDNIFVFDTETTIDEYQNLKIGYFRIYIKGTLNFEGLFHDNVNEKELSIILRYSKKRNIALFNKQEFIEEIFYPICYDSKFICLGYNLPFDLSRLCLSFGNARNNEKGGFSFKLSENDFKARIKIKQLNGNCSIIKFGAIPKMKNNFQGHFLDVQNLACIFTNKKRLSLEKACEIFDTKVKKQKSEEHGTISESYLDYLVDDVIGTYQVYRKILEEYKHYNIKIPLTKIFSSASLGKALFEELSIEKFNDLNLNFSSKILGKVMSAYFGGRCECKMRKTPTKVDVLDFTSMYPTLTLLMGLWDFITAKEIKYKDVTNEIQDLLNNITLEDLRKKDIWKQFNVLVEIVPNEDIVPIRSCYNKESKIPNISIAEFTSNKTFYYALPDIIASKLLKGKVPKIKSAIRFYANGKQENLGSINLFDSKIDVNNDNLILRLVEERQKIKESKDSYLELKQKALKILVNAVAYGIFIEVNPDDNNKDLEVFGNDSFECEGKFEKKGKYFNPTIAVMQTSGARLFLAICEAFVKDKGLTHYYMDTDSCFVSPEISKDLIDYFQDLSPYESKIPLLKVEKEDVWFYGISSKRYIVYTKEKDSIYVIDYKLHGLGHITNPFNSNISKWHEEIWLDILKYHYGFIQDIDLYNKYSNLYVISKITASNPNIMKRFNSMNKYRPIISEKIKPYNFLLIGIGTDKNIKPCTSYSSSPQTKVYEEFINYRTGDKMNGSIYWKPLYNEIMKYIDHEEHKLDGDIGLLQRKKINTNEIILIGKEINDLENESLNELFIGTYLKPDDIKDFINSLNPTIAREIGILQRSSLKKIKDKIRNKEKLNYNSKNMILIVDFVKKKEK
jgi:hypothetical protein